MTVYFKNRVSRIKEAKFDNQIYYTNSEDNAADLVSKVRPISAFLENEIWENGPNSRDPQSRKLYFQRKSNPARNKEAS